MTGLSIIFKPVFLSRFLSDQFRNQFAIFLSDNSLVVCPAFLGRERIIFIRRFLSRLFSNQFANLFTISLCSIAIQDSEAQLYAPQQKSQEELGRISTF
jgi:hypothetical protein